MYDKIDRLSKYLVYGAATVIFTVITATAALDGNLEAAVGAGLLTLLFGYLLRKRLGK